MTATCKERFHRLLTEHTCRTCGAAWEHHSLALIEESGTGLLLCTRGDMFLVLYPEGEVSAVDPARIFAPEPAVGIVSPPPRAGDHRLQTEPAGDPTRRPGGPFSAAARGGRDPGILRSEPSLESPPGPAVQLECPLCGRPRRPSAQAVTACARCSRQGLTILELGGAPRLVVDGHPVPWSPDVHFAGEQPRRQEAAHA